MGKCKKRIFAKAAKQKNPISITREEALHSVFYELLENPASNKAKDMISLFGLKAEELAEMGLSYEVLRALDCYLS